MFLFTKYLNPDPAANKLFKILPIDIDSEGIGTKLEKLLDAPVFIYGNIITYGG